jgi:hypothetical protein
MVETRILSLSHCISKQPIKGHPYWFHKHLTEAARQLKVPLVNLGPFDQESADIIGILAHPASLRSASSIFGLWDQDQDVSSFEKVLSGVNTQNVLHVYEGGFREFVFVLRILRKHKNVLALFNFNFTDPWHLLFSKRNLAAMLAVRIIRSEVAKLTPRFIAFAETQETAEKFSKRTSFHFTEYPLFSTISNQSTDRENKDRKFDAVFFPADEKELSIALETIGKLRDENSLHMPLIVPRWGLKLPSEKVSNLRKRGIHYYEEILSDDSYSALYASARIAVFPYETSYYQNTSSGRVLDAAAAGCYCIAPVESLPGRQIDRNGWGSSYTDLAQEVKLGLESWDSFVPRNVPTAAASLRILLEQASIAQQSRPVVLPGVPTNKHAQNLLLLTVLVLGTGFRSWVPRAFQGIKTLSRARVKTPKENRIIAS